MNVYAICGSPRKKGNTEQALTHIIDQVNKAGHQGEVITLAGKSIQGCIACGVCREKKDGHCYGRKDDLNSIIDQCRNADALILGSPVYFGSATPEIKCFIDRFGYSTRGLGNPMRNKLGGSVAVARRAGQNFTFGQMNYLFHILDMMQVGSTYWNIAFGKDKGDLQEDEEGIKTLSHYAENLCWALEHMK